MSSGLSLCTSDTSLRSQILASGRDLVDDAMLLGSTVMILALIRSARRRGLFSPATASWARRLGWFLLAGSILGPLLAALTRWAFVHRLAPDYSLIGSLLAPGIMWTVLITGAGVLTFARVLRVAVPLQEDAELTI